jgi:glycosyltransferase involved in cell wall biosynthesis
MKIKTEIKDHMFEYQNHTFEELNIQIPAKSAFQNDFTISIIIPTLNEERHIEKCLKSVFSQTFYSNIIEIFVIDGGSIDRTVEIVNQYCKEYPNLFLLNNKKKIQSAAFNIAVDKFKGDILIRLDAHCSYDRDYIQYCVRYHMISEYGNVGGRCSIEPGSDTNMAKVISVVSSSSFGLGFAAYRVGKNIMFTDSVPFGSFTKKVLSKVGKMDESLPRGEDNEYNSRIRQKGYKILFDPRIVSHYYSPADLKSFLKKMYSNGFSIGILLRVSRRSVSFRHIVPSASLLAFGLGLSMAFFNLFYESALILMIVSYFVLILTSGLTRLSLQNPKLISLYVYVVCLVHLVYGIGTLNGLIKGKFSNINSDRNKLQGND